MTTQPHDDHPRASSCSACGRKARLRYGSPWCDPCEAWIVDGDGLIDLRDPAPTARPQITPGGGRR